MNKNLLTVSVGIAAYNEEKNIERLLRSILKQQVHGFIIKKILVISDGSTDNTSKCAKMVRSKLIKVLSDKKRKGKPARMQQMINLNRSEILIFLDADIRLEKQTIKMVVNEFKADQRIMLVSADARPEKPTTFFEKAMWSILVPYFTARNEIRNGHTIYGCSGSCIAGKRIFLKSISFPQFIYEDGFLYFNCIKSHYLFRLAKNAHVFYKLPKNATDCIKQQFRSTPQIINKIFTEHFGDLLNQEYQKPPGLYIKSLIKGFLSFPVGFMLLSLIRLIIIMTYPLTFFKYNLSWYTAKSTK